MQSEAGTLYSWQQVASGLAAVWAEENTREAIFDAVERRDAYRKRGADGKLPAIGSTVDAAKASVTNTIGSPELAAVWTDPDFDPTQKAFYYARVIEIPTPRWTTFDAFRFGMDLPDGAPTEPQERAYTSPIWYTPKG